MENTNNGMVSGTIDAKMFHGGRASNLPCWHGLDYPFMQVREFHVAFDHPAPDVPTLMDGQRVKTRGKWLRSEIDEFEDPKKQTIKDQADAMFDVIYFALGTLVEIGVVPQALFNHVQAANMAKMHIGDDGVPYVKRRADGKIIKPDGWVGPEDAMQGEIDAQLLRKPLCEISA